MNYHQPVFLNKVIDIFDPTPDKTFIDATLGHGGHTIALLQSGSSVISIDTDPSSIDTAKSRIEILDLNDKFFPLNENYANITQAVSKLKKSKVNGILYDLGLNSFQQKYSNQGFSFAKDDLLDMRLSPNQKLKASDILNTYSPNQLYDIFSKISQDTHSKQIVNLIIKQRSQKSFKYTKDLSTIIESIYKSRGKIHPATKIFMALRMYINDEPQNLVTSLDQTFGLLLPGSPVLIITFNSTEDRTVKLWLNKNRNKINKQTIFLPTSNEIKDNPLCRSAKLRVFYV